MSKHTKRITSFQQQNGIYLDFEGFVDDRPALAGYLIDNDFRQVAFDPALISAAQAKNIPVVNFFDFVQELCEECEKNRRFIIGFSLYEKGVIERECRTNIDTRYKNGLAFCKRWRTGFISSVDVTPRSLAEYLQLIGYVVPEHLRKGSATKWLRSVISGLEARGNYARLTPKQRNSWDNLLEYNMHDVLGLQALLKRASQDLKR